jgi:hypothetical protein
MAGITLTPSTVPEFTGANPVEVDEVTAAALATLPDTNANGFVVKVAGNDTLYGRGQAFMVLEEGTGDATDDSTAGSVLYRVDAKGSIGLIGGIHVASGLRKTYGGTQAVWIDPSENTVGLVIHNPAVAEAATWDKDFIKVVNTRADPDDEVFRVAFNGEVKSTQTITAHDGKTAMTLIGDVFGLPGIGFGTSVDTLLYRAAASIVGVGNSFELPEVTEPAAPAANKARLYAKDNGAGKTQLCVRFPTGAVQVLATQP